MTSLWFKSKTYGWGWYPCSWQGWMVIVGCVAVLVAAAMLLLGWGCQTKIEMSGVWPE